VGERDEEVKEIKAMGLAAKASFSVYFITSLFVHNKAQAMDFFFLGGGGGMLRITVYRV
jgi:hypothetical protein